MAKKSKWFRVAFEGQTASDGRIVTAKELNECAQTFNADTHAAPVNIEHYRPIIPGGPLDMKGRVLALSAKADDAIEIGTGADAIKRKGVGLYAEIEPYDGLLELVAAKQKRYPSVEITPDFGGTGKFGMIGLALTDSPAVLGVEMMQFSTKAPAILNARKQNDANFLTATIESVELEIEDVADPAPMCEEAKAFASIRKFFDSLSGKTPEPKVEEPKKQDEPSAKSGETGGDVAKFAAELAPVLGAIEKSLAALSGAQAKTTADFSALSKKLEEEPDTRTFRRRDPVSGGPSKGAAIY